ncbi:unnamed protein product [Owenia fusiformis]|uniref:Uncharacterized protein n=1 Tax=Owenia fusiformis TaxID=6347 RepID=A0A8S4PE72_OWEFU|nr:unnamed protein product [Owenia fusiformis]
MKKLILLFLYSIFAVSVELTHADDRMQYKDDTSKLESLEKGVGELQAFKQIRSRLSKRIPGVDALSRCGQFAEQCSTLANFNSIESICCNNYTCKCDLWGTHCTCRRKNYSR